MPDDHTLEIEVSKEQNLNDIFSRLSAAGIEVLSMRNKTNRLEELFMRLVEQQPRRRPSHALASTTQSPTLVSQRIHVHAESLAAAPTSSVSARSSSASSIASSASGARRIVPPAITATLYFVIFGSLIGRRIGDMGGYTYIQYIAPGLIMMSVITNSYGNVVSSFFGAKFGKHIEELLVSPLPNWLIVAGYVHGRLVRGLIVGGVVTIITLIFTRPAHAQRRGRDLGGAAELDRVRARRHDQRGVREELRPDLLHSRRSC